MTDLKMTHGAFTTVQLHAYAVNKAVAIKRQARQSWQWLFGLIYIATKALDFATELYIQPFYAGKFEHEKKPITLAPLVFPQTNRIIPLKMLVKEAKVLLSIALSHGKQKTEDMVKEMRVWLTSRDRPMWVKSVDVVGVLPSNSALMLITLPFSLWDVLPEHPAYKKIDFVRGGNLLLENPDQHSLLRPMSSMNLRGSSESRTPPMRMSASSENIRPFSSLKDWA